MDARTGAPSLAATRDAAVNASGPGAAWWSEMLSIGKLAAGPGAGRYYVDQVADGREDYYSSEGEAPGRWIGAGSAELELDGRVGGDEILRLLAGQDPASGRALGRELKAGDVAGFDLTFRSPKRVSILFGVGDPALATAIRAGHDTAVSAALAYLEREACVVRRGRGGAVELQGRGSSRRPSSTVPRAPATPLLHTHVVVANAALGPWREPGADLPAYSSISRRT